LQIEVERNSFYWKDLGNTNFGKQKFNEALDCYKKSIALSSDDQEHISICLSNTGACFYELGNYQE
jgi:tetratricopeptide (TPR) repeat protein